MSEPVFIREAKPSFYIWCDEHVLITPSLVEWREVQEGEG